MNYNVILHMSKLKVFAGKKFVGAQILNFLSRLEMWLPAYSPFLTILSNTLNFQLLSNTDDVNNRHDLTNYQEIPHFDSLVIYSSGKHCEKRRNCLEQAIFPFLKMIST